MKLLHILLSMLGLGILTGCKKSGYETKDGSVYYKDYLIREADYGSFEELNAVFAKDKNQGYYRGIPLSDTDGTSFTALDDYYAKDKSSVFYCDNYIDFKLFETSRKDKISRIPNADANSFVAIANEHVYEYAKDKFRCYYKGSGFAVKDVDSFEPLDYLFGKDKAVGYFNFKPIPHSEGHSFTVSSRNFSKDNRNVYYSWTTLEGATTPGIRIIKQADPASFTVAGMYHATDKTHAYYLDKPLEAADPTSFKKWDEYNINYAADSTHIYFQDKLITQADRLSFRLLTDDYAQDTKTVFYADKPLNDSDVTSFTVLQSGYAKDRKHIYYEGRILTGADPVSFALVENEADRDAADKTHSYHEGRQIKPETE